MSAAARCAGGPRLLRRILQPLDQVHLHLFVLLLGDATRLELLLERSQGSFDLSRIIHFAVDRVADRAADPCDGPERTGHRQAEYLEKHRHLLHSGVTRTLRAVARASGRANLTRI